MAHVGIRDAQCCMNCENFAERGHPQIEPIWWCKRFNTEVKRTNTCIDWEMKEDGKDTKDHT